MQVKTPTSIPYISEIPRWIYNHWVIYYTGAMLPLLQIILLFLSSIFNNYMIYFLLILPISIFTILPIIDHISKDYFITYVDPKSLKRPQAKETDENRWYFWYKSALYVFVIVQLGLFIYSAYFVQRINPNDWKFWLICLNNGIIMTFSMGVAHELYHKRGLIDKFCGILLLTLGSYSHFYILLEHIDGHHKHVATRLDPNTAYYNESVYEFIPRSFFGGYFNSWILEKERLKRISKPFFSLSNRMLWFSFICIILPILMYYLFGKIGLTLYFAQALVSMIFTETINYIEHYALERKLVNGVYENVGYEHSWDAPYRFSCYLGTNILLHADHHMHAFKEYEKLAAIEGAPIMPHTYVTMLLMSYVPPLYFNVVNPILEEHKKKVQCK